MTREMSSTSLSGPCAPSACASRALRIALAAGAAASVTLSAGQAFAGPRGEQVVRGSADISRNGSSTVIRAADKTIIRFQSFDIGSHESVQFIQPSSRSRVLNRIDGLTPTTIEGQLTANGRVYIVNPSGVIFGPNSVVNAARVYAVGGSIADADFLRGVDHFTNVSGPVTAHGLMTADAVHLIGSRVAHHGTILADRGMVSMLVGDDVFIGERGGQIYVRIDGAEVNGAAKPQSGGSAPDVHAAPGVENTGAVRAEGGRVVLGAGDTYSLAVRNSGDISVGRGSAQLASNGGAVVNTGGVSASVASGKAGQVFLAGPMVLNSGAVTADAQSGRAGVVTVHSSSGTTLADGSLLSASGGAGKAQGGVINVQAYAGDTVMATSATVDISGGALGGHGGFVEVSAAGRLGVHGAIVGGAQPGYKAGAVLFDPLDIIISTGPELPGGFDGDVDAGDGGVGDIFRIEPATIENFAGDVRLEATRDIYVGEPINKSNGGLTLDAGRDVLFSGEFGGFIPDLTITANFIDIIAGRTFDDRSLLGTKLTSLMGGISLEAAGGSLDFGLATVPSGRTLRLTQRDDMYVGAGPFGLVGNRQNTNLIVNVTGGWLILGGEFGGVDGGLPGNEQRLRSLRATASDFLRVEDNVIVANFADLSSPGEVQVDGFIRATAPGSSITLHGGTDGAGRVRFLSPGLDLAADSITLRAGNNTGLANADVDALTNSPLFRGPSLGASRPVTFSYIQDAPVPNSDLPSASQFGAHLAGMNYRIESSDATVTVSDNDAVDGSRLTLASQTGSTVADDLTLTSLRVIGPVTLASDVTTTEDQLYEGAATLATDVALTGDEVEFQSTLDGARSALMAADVTFGGAVGSGTALQSLAVTGVTAINGGLVRTVAGQSYAGAVTFDGDTRTTSLDQGVIRFGGAVDGPHDLTVTTTPGGLIIFGGDVGASQRLRDLRLSTAGGLGTRDVPDRATIIGVGSVSIFARDFIMNAREKFTTLGDLSIDASRAAFVGDLTTAGDMTVSAPTIHILRRAADDLLDIDGNTVSDRGVDFVARGAIQFNGAIVLAGEAGAPDPTFGSATQGAVDPDLAGFEFGMIEPSLVTTSGLDRVGLVRDERTMAAVVPPQDPGDPAVNAALAGGYPRPPEFVDTVQPEVYNIDALQRVMIASRGVSMDESIAFVDGRALYNDLPGTIDPAGAAVSSVAPRFDIDLVAQTVELYDSLFGVGEEEDVQRVADAVSGAAESYYSTRGGAQASPGDFDAWLASQPGQNAAIAYVQQVRTLLSQMQTLGLTPTELRQSQARLLRQLAVGGVSLRELSAILAPGAAPSAAPARQAPGPSASRSGL